MRRGGSWVGSMDVAFVKKDPKDAKAEVLAIPCFEGECPGWAAGELKKSGAGADFKGKKGTYIVLATPGKAHTRLLLVGLGPKKGASREGFRAAGGKIAKLARRAEWKAVTAGIPGYGKKMGEGDAASALVEGVLLGSLKLDLYKTKKEKKVQLGKLTVACTKNIGKNVDEAAVLAEAQNYVRMIAAEPANVMTPFELARVARELARDYKLKYRLFTKKDLEKNKMNALLSVSQGSVQEPVMVELGYSGGKKGAPHIALVGKGITFDSGGISLKPGKGMYDMKYDKCGFVTMLGVMRAAAELKLPLQITAVLPATENMPSGSASKPGDIVRAYNGKTIEILNTDAEGRMILADALAYAAEKKPDLIIDAATLTGAVIVCLGKAGAGMMGTSDKAINGLEKAGMHTHERVWQLPLWEDYSEMMKSDIADLKNIGSENGEAGTITAGAFLKEFTGGRPWVHLDIAGVSDFKGNNSYLGKGATGIGVRLITTFLRGWKK